jgi:hypothetical protein
VAICNHLVHDLQQAVLSVTICANFMDAKEMPKSALVNPAAIDDIVGQSWNRVEEFDT